MKKLVLFCLFLFVLSGLAIASFSIGNPVSDIEITYSKGSNLRGWINISLDNQPVNSLLTANIQGQINLKDFLDENDADYDCVPDDCESSYSGKNSAESKTITLSTGEEKFYVLGVNGIIDKIESLSFSISSNAVTSCLNPLKIDLGEEDIDWKFNESSDDFSCKEEKSTCYEDSLGNLESELRETAYCTEINLKEASKFELGAWVKKGTTENVVLKMQIISLDEELLKECQLPDASVAGGLINCNVEFVSSGQDYYVCIKADKSTDWKIKSETHNPCGSFGFPFNEEIDVYVYVKNSKFKALPDLNIGNTEIQNNYFESFSNLIEEYIYDKYNNDCEEGCYIPIRFSGISQELTINNIALRYSTTATGKTSRFIYESIEEQPTIDTNLDRIVNLGAAIKTMMRETAFPKILDNHPVIQKLKKNTLR